MADKPRVKTFSCSNCGASVTISQPGASLSVVCKSCGVVIDATDENYRIVSTYIQKIQSEEPAIPLGTRGKLFGKLWEVIGFMIRADAATGQYTWREYLLFNPYYGYRWLLEDDGHWNFTTPIKEKPVIGDGGYAAGSTKWAKTAQFEGNTYKVFNSGEVKVLFVLGEFYWKVNVSNVVMMEDYISPPYMLSSEVDGSEVNWSLSEYVEPDVIKAAFKLKRLPARTGVGSTQPSPNAAISKQMWKMWVLFMLALTSIEAYKLFTSSNSTVFRETYPYAAHAKLTDVTTKVFKLEKEVANVNLDFWADVDNSWLYVSGELVNDATGQSYPFERTIEQYSGYDDGPWTEGSTRSDIVMSRIPGGQYYINMDTESGDRPADTGTHAFSLTVIRDVPRFGNYLVCAFFLSVFPLWFWMKSRGDEVRRWSNSDYSPYTGSSSSSSDEE